MFSVAVPLDTADAKHPRSLARFLEHAPAVFWITDAELRLTYVSGPLAETLELSVGQCVGKNADRLIPHRASAERCSQLHRRAIEGSGGSTVLLLGGRELEARVEPMRGQDGAIAGVVGVAFDVTEMQFAERILRLSEQNCRSLLEEMPYAISRCTLSGQILQVNASMLEMLGYASEPELLVCDLPTQIFANQEDFDQARRRMVEHGNLQGFEARWLRADGRAFQVQLGGRAVRDAAGEVLYLDVLAEDITQRKELEAQLLQSQKMHSIGQLAGGVAHDFNNLLMVIGGQVEVMTERTLDRDFQHRLGEVRRATERAATLTRQLLAFSRRQVMQSRTVDLNVVLGGMVQMLSRLISENIEFHFQPAKEEVCARVDPCQIEQVLLNLCVNARDAMPDGGKLTVELAAVVEPDPFGALPPGGYVRLSVQDTGHGIDPAVQAHIFEPFFTTKKLGEGTGLGLSVVYGIVRQSGGHIRLESAPGKGSTFHVYLPQAAGGKPSKPDPRPAPAPRGRETILVAEDEESVRDLVQSFLRRLGYHVIAAEDGESALELAASYPGEIHLLLSDVVMPRVGGVELARNLLQQRPEIKVTFMTGYVGSASEHLDALFSKASVLTKPFPLPALARLIRDALDGSSAEVSAP